MLNKIRSLFVREKKSYGAYSLLSGPWGAWEWNDGSVKGWGYRKWAYLGYSINPISYRAVNIIADAVAGVPWILYRKMADDRDIKIEQAPVLELLKRPNPWMGEKDFFAQFIQYLQLSGNTFIKSAGPNTGPQKELYFLRPERIEILNSDCGDICLDEFGSLIYEYTCGKSKERIDLRHFHHCKNWNPLCDAWGLSPLQPASSSIDLLNEALQWNVSLLKNSCSPSGVLSSENNLSDEQIARLRDQMEVKHQGVWNSGKPILLEGGLSFSAMGLSPKEADWIHAVELATKQIYLCLGIDPSLGGDSKSKTFANYRDGEKNFYTATVIPLLEKIRDDFLNRWLLPRFNMGDNVYFQYDIEAIECLSEQRGELWVRMISGVESGIITINEAREELGYDLVVIHVDLVANTADYRILTGNLTPTQSSTVWELPLAGISVPSGAVSITISNIQDLRVISDDNTLKTLITLTKSTDTTIASGQEITLAWDTPTQPNDVYRYYTLNNYIQTRVGAFYNVQSQFRWAPASTNSKPVVFKVYMVSPADFRTTEIYSVSSVQTSAGDVSFTFDQVLQIPQSYYVYMSVKNTTDVSITLKSAPSISPFLRLQFTTYPIQLF